MEIVFEQISQLQTLVQESGVEITETKCENAPHNFSIEKIFPFHLQDWKLKIKQEMCEHSNKNVGVDV